MKPIQKGLGEAQPGTECVCPCSTNNQRQVAMPLPLVELGVCVGLTSGSDRGVDPERPGGEAQPGTECERALCPSSTNKHEWATSTRPAPTPSVTSPATTNDRELRPGARIMSKDQVHRHVHMLNALSTDAQQIHVQQNTCSTSYRERGSKAKSQVHRATHLCNNNIRQMNRHSDNIRQMNKYKVHRATHLRVPRPCVADPADQPTQGRGELWLNSSLFWWL